MVHRKTDEGHKCNNSATSGGGGGGGFICETQKLAGCYFHAVNVTTEALLNTLVGMIFVTLATQGFTTVKDYCLKELKWKSSHMKSFFSSDERKCLKLNPTEMPFSAKLNIKLLTNVWKGLGEGVAQRVRDLEHLRKVAIHDPPTIPSRDQLRQHLCQLFSQQKELTKIVLRYCHEELKECLSSLYQEEMSLKRKIALIFRELMLSKESLYTLSLNKAVAAMEVHYQLLCIGQNKIPVMCKSQSLVKNINTLLDVREKLDQMDDNLKVHIQQSFTLREKIVEIKCLYIALIDRSNLYDIIAMFNDVGDADVSHSKLQEWYQQLLLQQKDGKGRLEVLGRSEIQSYTVGVLSHNSRCDGPFVWDVNKWLLTRKAAELNVNKVYSLIRRSDTDEVIPIDQFLNSQLPQVTVLSGPVGSGKTCLCHYLFDKWLTPCSRVKYLRDKELFIFLREGNVKASSFLHHLKAELFQRSFIGQEDSSEVYATFRKLKVVFVVDGFSSSDSGFVVAVQELVRGLGQNTAIITTQPQDGKEVLRVLREVKTELLEAHLCPLGKAELTDLSLNLLKALYPPENSEGQFSATGEPVIRGQPKGSSLPIAASSQEYSGQQCCNPNSEPRLGLAGRASFTADDVQNSVKRFVDQLLCEEREEELLYPLPVSYMIMLWLEDPRKLNRITTMSRLFDEVLSFCNDKLNSKIQDVYTVQKRFINTKSKEKLQMLLEMACKVFHCEVSPISAPSISELGEEEFNFSDICADSLFPFLMCCSEGHSHQQNHTHRFLHRCLIYMLFARRTIHKLTSPRGRWLVFFKNNLRDVLPLASVQNTGRKYIGVIKYLCGFLTRSQQLRANTAGHIVELYKCAGVDVSDYPSWVSLLREGMWSPVLVKATFGALATENTWKVPSKSCPETRAVSQLVAHGAYLPHEVIITHELPAEITSLLLAHPAIDVRVLPTRSFLGVSKEGQQRDGLLQALAEAGSVTELWGKLGLEGTTALASMTRLHTMYVCLTSLDSVIVLCRSISSCLALQYLSLHLNLPPSTTPTDAVPALQCPPSVSIMLNLYGIEDKSWVWAVRVIKKLGSCFQEVHLAKACISPSSLQALKQELHPIPVHTSQ